MTRTTHSGIEDGLDATAFDAVVVGAGIVGVACAAAVARDGHRVAVIDGKGIGAGTTSAGMGHLVVMDDSEAQFALTNYSRRLWTEMAAALPDESEFENCGTLWVASDDEELEGARRKAEFYRDRGVACEIVDERGLRQLEPNLRQGLAGGLRVPGDSVVYQPRAALAIAESARDAGARFSLGRSVARIDDRGVVLQDGSAIAAGTVIVAAGLGSNDLIDGLGIRRKKGHLVITERYRGFIGHQVIELGYLKSAHASESDSAAFNVQPRSTGQVLIGSSRQFDVADTDVDHVILSRMLRRAASFMPALSELAAVRVWTGFRPATADNLPLIGRHPERPNVILATGHEGLGITTATGTAQIVSDIVAGRNPSIDAAPFDPARLLR